MNNEGKAEVAIAEAARQLQTIEEQAAYLEKACAGDPELCRRVEALLENDTSAKPGSAPSPQGQFEHPAVGPPDFLVHETAPKRKRRAWLFAAIIAAAALLGGLAVYMVKHARLAPAADERAETTAPIQTDDDALSADAETTPLEPSIEAATRRVKGVNVGACPYDFSARIKTFSGSVYRLSKLQTLSRFPFPQNAKERFGRLMVMAWAPRNDSANVQPAPVRHFWFSKLRRLRNVADHLEIQTISGQTLVSEEGWLSNYRHKRYPYEYKDTAHDIVVGLNNTRLIGIDTRDIEEIEFTTSANEARRLENDLNAILPPSQPAVFRFEKRIVTADRFFLLDGAGEWYKTIFTHPWWPGGHDFTIWHDTGEGMSNFWEMPQLFILKPEIKTIEFGPPPEYIRTKVTLQTGEELSGYFVTHTESQKGAWQWQLGLQGFWDSVVLVTEDGLDVYAMFPGGPNFERFARESGPLHSITFDTSKTEKKSK